MTASDPAHPPRPGEGTGPLPRISSPPASPHSTGPLPPLPEGVPETPLVQAMRRQLPAINGGRKSLRGGLAEIVIAVLGPSDPEEPLTAETGEMLLQDIPDVILRHWLGKVAAEEIAFETFLGAVIAEGLVTGYKGSLSSLSRFAQQASGDPDAPSPMAVLNLYNQFDSGGDEIKMTLAEMMAQRATDMLRGGLDAQTANQLVLVLQSVRQ